MLLLHLPNPQELQPILKCSTQFKNNIKKIKINMYTIKGETDHQPRLDA